jgi:uncharacterized protein YdeI (YjbR/CyaY-like superfamily)
MQEPHRDRWQAETDALRAILASEGLDEAVKWAKPCFLRHGANVAIIQPFRDEVRLMFFKGAILPDPAGILGSQGDNTQGARVVRFASTDDVSRLEAPLRALIRAAIAAEDRGETPAYPARAALDLPDELVSALDGDPDLAEAFHALTPGRQRSWVLHIAGAKQSATRTARITKAAPMIRAGKGWNER